MVERSSQPIDIFAEYRLSDSAHWYTVKPLLIKIFEGKIPSELEPHLIEWAVIRGKGHTSEIGRDQMNITLRNFGDSHAEMYNNEKFAQALGIISSKLTLAG